LLGGLAGAFQLFFFESIVNVVDSGGEGEIRTPEALASLPVFKSHEPYVRGHR
jgi:hypothetical protein